MQFSKYGDDAANMLRGALMGAADIVPGISGGTVALILGIYTRLLTAITHFDLTLLGHLARGRFRDAAKYVDLRFLVSLGAGIVCGFAVMTFLMLEFLTNPTTRPFCLAALFGMILASGVLVIRLIHSKSMIDVVRLVALGVVGAGFAWWLSTLNAERASDPGLVYLFLCGSVAICAMILPGISGAMVLLLLGVYIHLTELIKEFPSHLLHGEPIGESLLTIVVFASGCATGLLVFSRFLRWLLVWQPSHTMALLCGFIFGALPMLWPFQEDLTPHIEKLKYKTFAAAWPEWDFSSLAVFGMVALAATFVIVVDAVARRRPKGKDQGQEPSLLSDASR